MSSRCAHPEASSWPSRSAAGAQTRVCARALERLPGRRSCRRGPSFNLPPSLSQGSLLHPTCFRLYFRRWLRRALLFLAHTLSNTDSCFLCPQHSTLLLGSVHDPTACVCNPGHAANVINGDGTVGSPCTSCILSNYDGRSLASHGQLHCRSLTTMRSEAGGWRMELEAKSRIEGRCAANGSATLL